MQQILTAPLDISFHLTHACNLRCKHCYLRAGNPDQNELSHSQMNEVLDKLIKMKIFKILLTGGEPTLRKDFLYIIKKLHQKMWMTLSTNGNFIDDNNVEELTRYIKEFAISIDGATAKSHDAFRGMKGTFDKTINAIHSINKLGKKDIRLVINTTLAKHNIGEIEEMMDLAYSLNAHYIRFSILYPKGRALDNRDLFLNNVETKNILLRIIQKRKDVDIKISFDDGLQVPIRLYGYENDLGDLGSNDHNYKNRKDSENICGIAHTMFSILPNGDIIPCDFFDPESIIGNALKDDLSILWRESKILNDLRKGIKPSEICRSCKFENKCITIKCPALIVTKSYWCNWFEPQDNKNR